MITNKLGIPLIAAGQSQKHVTHNEALLTIDELLHLSVLREDLTAPPPNPAEGDSYLVASGATGAWAGKDGTIAVVRNAVWLHHEPRPGWRCHVLNESRQLMFTATGWSASERFEQLGISTNANATDRLSVSGPATLLNGDTGGHHLKINKAQATQTGAVLFQTGFSGRAEIGLTGDDNCHFKVSDDGTTWREALIIDRSTGAVTLPLTPALSNPNLLINGDFQINQRGFAGGNLAAGVYGPDRWKADVGGASLSLSGFVVTLNSGALVQLIEPAVWGRASFAGATLTVSVDTPSADLTVGLGGASGTITAGMGRRSVTLQVPAGVTGNLSLRLAGAAGAVSFGQVKIEIGNRATPWVPTPLPAAQQLCRRYYWRSPLAGFACSLYAPGAGYELSQIVTFPCSMRSAPALTIQSTGSTLYGCTLGVTNGTRDLFRFSTHSSVAGLIWWIAGPGAYIEADAEL